MRSPATGCTTTTSTVLLAGGSNRMWRRSIAALTRVEVLKVSTNRQDPGGCLHSSSPNVSADVSAVMTSVSSEPHQEAITLPIGVSSCPCGSEVRVDGGHRRDRFARDAPGAGMTASRWCPEFAIGLGFAPLRPVVAYREGHYRLAAPARLPRCHFVRHPDDRVSRRDCRRSIPDHTALRNQL